MRLPVILVILQVVSCLDVVVTWDRSALSASTFLCDLSLCRKLLVDGNVFDIHGVCYSPG